MGMEFLGGNNPDKLNALGCFQVENGAPANSIDSNPVNQISTVVVTPSADTARKETQLIRLDGGESNATEIWVSLCVLAFVTPCESGDGQQVQSCRSDHFTSLSGAEAERPFAGPVGIKSGRKISRASTITTPTPASKGAPGFTQGHPVERQSGFDRD
jgi:hypothetical protein